MSDDLVEPGWWGVVPAGLEHAHLLWAVRVDPDHADHVTTLCGLTGDRYDFPVGTAICACPDCVRTVDPVTL
jgi:hypothetical protein